MAHDTGNYSVSFFPSQGFSWISAYIAGPFLDLKHSNVEGVFVLFLFFFFLLNSVIELNW